MCFSLWNGYIVYSAILERERASGESVFYPFGSKIYKMESSIS